MSDPIKLAIVGLSRVGKTSIYKKCFEDSSIEDIKKSLPTIMISQNLVNVDNVSKGISIWDFGGQESFRSAYLKNPKYFDETRIIIFVIDVFEIKHLHEAEDYFQSILNIFGNKKKPNIFVFLHKCDPDKKEL
ncbi:MAG: ADP-ribosylation factor-like protein, partial [Candidatus Helarchaeota archaeon]